MAGRHPVANLTIVVAAVLGVGFVASGYLNYVQYERDQQDEQQLHGTITDLKYQLGLDEKSMAASPSRSLSPSATPSPSVTPTPTATPAVLGDQTTPTPTPAARTATTNGFVHMRAAASTSSAIVANLNAGTVLTLGSFANAQWQQATADGHTGYVDKSYVKY